MKVLISAALIAASLIGFTSTAQSNDPMLEEAKKRCAPELPDDLRVYSDDFSWNMSLEKMAQTYEFIYNSGKRLPKRAYFDPAKNKFYTDKYEFNGERKKVELSEDFLISVRQHIEEGLKREYVQYVFFPDMGHSHAFVPQTYYDEVISKVPNGEGNKRYELLFNYGGTKLLYHTAEQLHMKDNETNEIVSDEFLRWRYYTRNLVGGLKPPAKIEIHKDLSGKFNTVRENPGYRYWGSGFDMSASKNGCFPFKTKSGEIQYFDISLHSLESNPNIKKDWGPTNAED